MDKRNLKKRRSKKSEAIHLLPEIDVKSVKNYIRELSRLYRLKKSEFSAECTICTSSIDNWQDLELHLGNPSHIDKNKRDSKYFTAFCILCRHIFIADDTSLLFEHFALHKTKGGKKNEQVQDYTKIHKSLDDDPASHSSSISTSTLINKIDVDTRTTNYKHEVNTIPEDFEHSNISDSMISTNRYAVYPDNLNEKKKHSPMISYCVTNSSSSIFNDTPEVGRKLLKENQNQTNSIYQKKNIGTMVIDSDVHETSRGHRLKLNCIGTSSNRGTVSTDSKELIYSSIPVLYPSRRGIKNNVSDQVSSQNCVPDISTKHYFPKQAFFSDTTLQLTKPGVSKEEFTVTQEVNDVNIKAYCKKTYYSLYYGLRKLYYSCLECNALRLQEIDFYRHLKGDKHYNKLGDAYSIGFIKICDVCQVLLLGDMDLLIEHFQCFTHKKNVKCKYDLIEQQYAAISATYGKAPLKLGFSGELSDRCTTLFSSMEALNNWVECSLTEAREVTSLAPSVHRILERDIKITLKEKYTDFLVKIVGSRLYGLANHQSDVDIHLAIGEASVGDLEEYFQRVEHLFEVKRTILDAKVPIIRLKHLQSGLICDINTTNPTGPYCSELIKLYISLDDRIRWLAMAILQWSAENAIRGTRKFKSYALICLLLFFLMSPKIRLIPSVHTLKSLYEGRRVYIKGWDYSFCSDIEKIKKVHNPLLCNFNKYELLAEFFKYYERLDVKKNVLFLHNGEIYRKVVFANPSLCIYPGVHTNQEDNEPLSIGGQFVIIDFFCLRENVNRSVDENLLDHFKSICSKTLTCGWQN